MLQNKLVKIDHYDEIDFIYMNRFIQDSMTATYTLDIIVRNLQIIQKAAASKDKHDSQLKTVTAKFEVVKVSECRELTLVKVKKKKKKTKIVEK
jgi:hypothetical protein